MPERKLDVLDKIYDFFQLERKQEYGEFAQEVKLACLSRLFMSIGVKDGGRFQSEFFDFFSVVLGQAVCEYFNMGVTIAGADLRYLRYEGINIIDSVLQLLKTEEMEEAILDAFDIVDRFKYLIPILKN